MQVRAVPGEHGNSGDMTHEGVGGKLVATLAALSWRQWSDLALEFILHSPRCTCSGSYFAKPTMLDALGMQAWVF